MAIKLNAQSQAILITQFDNGCSDAIAHINKITRLVEGLDGYQSNHRAQLEELIADAKANLKKCTASIEDERNIVKKKRDYLIQSEGENIFKGVEIEKPKTTIPVV